MLLSLARGRQQRLPATQLILAVALVIWTGVMLVLGTGRLADRAPVTRGTLEAVVAFASFFGALVMLLFPRGAGSRRLWWVAAALIVTGISAFVFGISAGFNGHDQSASSAAYAWLATRLVAALFLCFAVSAAPPAAARRRAVVVAALLASAACIAVALLSPLLPVLIHGSTSSEAVYRSGVRQGLTPAFWLLSIAPLALSLLALARAPAMARRHEVPWWFTPALLLFAAGQIHGELWPSAYTSIVTLSDLLRLGFVLLLAAGATITLLRVADEREAMLALERQRARTAGHEAEVARDANAVVAHELAGPLGAIRRLVDTMATGDLSAAEQTHAMAMIEAEAGLLGALVTDIQAVVLADGAEFPIDAGPVPVIDLLRPAGVFLEALPGYHPLHLHCAVPEDTLVMADLGRITQVLRNLVGNAAKFSDPGMPIVIQALPAQNGSVILEVRDRGWGIHADDRGRIFRKYERGRGDGRRSNGLGVGLYLCQRIVEAHGSTIAVESEPGKGSSFCFELERAE
jgi:signal transduction histidine kinase